MRPINFRGANVTFTKPDSLTDEQCVPLHAFRGEDSSGNPVIKTLWQPNKEDLEAIKAGQPIHIQVIGTAFPPMSVYTVTEEGEVN